MSTVYSPLRYPGGKNCIFPFIASLVNENGMLGCTYIEPYAGGAGLALRLLYEEYAERVVINDLDPLVNAFWFTCVHDAPRFVDWIESTPVTVATWRRCRELIRNPRGASIFEKATSFFFLNRTNVSGVLSGGVIGGLEQAGTYKINARYNKDELIDKIEKIAKFSERITVSNDDGISLVKKYDRKASTKNFIYLDPPYYEKGARLYLNSYNEADHARLSKHVAKLTTPWLLSYDNHPFIINLYPSFSKRAYKLQHSTSNKIGDEVLIFPDSIAFQESVHLLNGVTAA